MSSIMPLESLEDELQAVVKAGAYASQEEAIRHALEVLLAANPHLRVNTAVELYSRDQVTLSRAAEIAGLELETLKERLAEQDIPIAGDESSEEIQAGAELIHRLRENS